MPPRRRRRRQIRALDAATATTSTAAPQRFQRRRQRRDASSAHPPADNNVEAHHAVVPALVLVRQESVDDALGAAAAVEPLPAPASHAAVAVAVAATRRHDALPANADANGDDNDHALDVTAHLWQLMPAPKTTKRTTTRRTRTCSATSATSSAVSSTSSIIAVAGDIVPAPLSPLPLPRASLQHHFHAVPASPAPTASRAYEVVVDDAKSGNATDHDLRSDKASTHSTTRAKSLAAKSHHSSSRAHDARTERLHPDQPDSRISDASSPPTAVVRSVTIGCRIFCIQAHRTNQSPTTDGTMPRASTRVLCTGCGDDGDPTKWPVPRPTGALGAFALPKHARLRRASSNSTVTDVAPPTPPVPSVRSAKPYVVPEEDEDELIDLDTALAAARAPTAPEAASTKSAATATAGATARRDSPLAGILRRRRTAGTLRGEADGVSVRSAATSHWSYVPPRPGAAPSQISLVPSATTARGRQGKLAANPSSSATRLADWPSTTVAAQQPPQRAWTSPALAHSVSVPNLRSAAAAADAEWAKNAPGTQMQYNPALVPSHADLHAAVSHHLLAAAAASPPTLFAAAGTPVLHHLYPHHHHHHSPTTTTHLCAWPPASAASAAAAAQSQCTCPAPPAFAYYSPPSLAAGSPYYATYALSPPHTPPVRHDPTGVETRSTRSTRSARSSNSTRSAAPPVVYGAAELARHYDRVPGTLTATHRATSLPCALVPTESAAAATALASQLGAMGGCANAQQIAPVPNVFERASGKGGCYVVVERAGARVLDALASAPTVTELDVARIVAQMVAALASAHRVGVVHGRVAPDCVVQARDGEDPWAVQVAWAGAENEDEDYGDPRCWAPEVAVAMHAAAKSTSKRASDSSTTAAAASAARATATTPAADMWSAGTVAYVLLTGQLPYAATRAIRRLATSTTSAFPPPVTDASTPPAWAHISPYARDWLARVLAVPPGARISAVDALAHPWLATARAHAARRDPVVVAMMAAVNVGQVLRGQLATADVVAWAEPRKSVNAAADAKSVRSVAKSARSVRSVPAARGGRRRRLAFPRIVPPSPPARGRAGTGASVVTAAVRDEWEDVDDAEDAEDESAIESDSDSDSAWSDASSTRATGATRSSTRQSTQRGTSVASSRTSSSARRRRVGGRVRRAPPLVPRPAAPVPVQPTVPVAMSPATPAARRLRPVASAPALNVVREMVVTGASANAV
ncbi:Serine/threonine-protein kinase H1 [Allomyces javanicus]|nr:Serine/threonine-protein kinase H1 [Allomyces javanicus]